MLNVAKWQSGVVAAKSNLEGHEITDQSLQYYGSFKFAKFVLKIAPNRGAKFGSARIFLYLCTIESEE